MFPARAVLYWTWAADRHISFYEHHSERAGIAAKNGTPGNAGGHRDPAFAPEAGAPGASAAISRPNMGTHGRVFRTVPGAGFHISTVAALVRGLPGHQPVVSHPIPRSGSKSAAGRAVGAFGNEEEERGRPLRRLCGPGTWSILSGGDLISRTKSVQEQDTLGALKVPKKRCRKTLLGN